MLEACRAWSEPDWRMAGSLTSTPAGLPLASPIYIPHAGGSKDKVTPFLRQILGLNWLVMAGMLALPAFGVVAIYSATYLRQDALAAEFWLTLANWRVVALILFIIVGF